MVNNVANEMTDDLKRKLKAIKRLAEDAGTEAEGVAAMMAFQRLLASNGLNEAQATIVVEADAASPEVVELFCDDFMDTNRLPKYISALRSIIACHFRCASITHSFVGYKRFAFVGIGDDPHIAQGAFEAAMAVIDRMWLRHADDIRMRRALTRGDKFDYATAFANGLHAAYQTQEDTTELGLVIVRDKAIDEHLAGITGIKKQRLAMRPVSDESIERLGYIDGNNFGRGNTLDGSTHIRACLSR